MIQQETMSKIELLTEIHNGWDTLHAHLSTFTEEQITQPTDAAGWTVKDHIIHLAIWEKGMDALLNGGLRHEAMGIDLFTWNTADYDRINDIIQKRYQDMPLQEVYHTFKQIHERFIKTVEKLSESDLRLPYHTFKPGSELDRPMIIWIINNTYEHYAEHLPWITEIVHS